VLVIACVATALVILSINLPTVILPEIAGNLSASFAEQQWVVNAYALSLAALLLTVGSLSDRLGRKRVFVAGLVWFLLSDFFLASASEASNAAVSTISAATASATKPIILLVSITRLILYYAPLWLWPPFSSVA